MNHDVFREAVGADPTRLTDELRSHRDACTDCRRYHEELLAIEEKIAAALRIDVPSKVTEITARPTRPMPGLGVWRRRLAASLGGAAVLVAALLAASSKDALAHVVALHMDEEPESRLVRPAVDTETLGRVLAAEGIELSSGGLTVTYAQSCPLRGHTVAHLVVQSAHGPVTVLVMPSESVEARRAFHDHGYRGILVPAPHGALAVLSAGEADVDAIAAAVQTRIRYRD